MEWNGNTQFGLTRADHSTWSRSHILNGPNQTQNQPIRLKIDGFKVGPIPFAFLSLFKPKKRQ